MKHTAILNKNGFYTVTTFKLPELDKYEYRFDYETHVWKTETNSNQCVRVTRRTCIKEAIKHHRYMVCMLSRPKMPCKSST